MHEEAVEMLRDLDSSEIFASLVPEILRLGDSHVGGRSLSAEKSPTLDMSLQQRQKKVIVLGSETWEE